MLVALKEYEKGANDALRIYSGMGIEILVLGRNEGVFDKRRNSGARQIEAALAGVFGNKRTVARVNSRHNGRFVILERRIVRQVAPEFPNQERCPEGSDDEKDRAGGENEP